VQTVVVDGYPNQAIDINFNVRIYKNQTVGAGPQPRDNAAGLICSYTNVLGTFSATGVTGAQWTIQLPASCAMNSTATVKNRWVAVQAALDQALGQWFWATQTTADFNEADWRDIPNLFGLTCRSFRKPVTGSDNGRNKLMQDCLFGGDMGERDFIMTLQ
jgi:hypothetical protein